MNNNNLTSFADHLDKQYGKLGTDERNAYEEGFKIFKQEVLKANHPTAIIDPASNVYRNKVMFPKKLEQEKRSF